MSSANQRQDKKKDGEGDGKGKKEARKEEKPADDDQHRRREEDEGQQADEIGEDRDQELDEAMEHLDEIVDKAMEHLDEAMEHLDEIMDDLDEMIDDDLRSYSGDEGETGDGSYYSNDDESLMSGGGEKQGEGVSEEKANNTTLLPWDVKSVSDAIQRFVDTFKARYGDNAPPFYIGELKDAAEEAFEPESFDDRKLLALYIHNDHALAHNVFATRIMCSAEISALLRHQFVVWPWDKTLPVNRERLDAYLDAAGMRAVREMLERVGEDKYPLLVVVGSIGNSKEKKRVPIVIISGRHDAETAMARLLVGLDHHMTTVSMERSRRDLGAQIQYGGEEGDAAAAAVAATTQRVKEPSKKTMGGEAKRGGPPTAEEMQHRASIAYILPLEPDVASDEGVVTVKARTPDGLETSRRFPAASALSSLVYWLRSLGYDTSHHKFLAPAHGDISTLDLSQSFADLGWMRREQVMVIETD